ncbi:MAG: hypothetical protein HY717_06430 [Planctomycetes bacterium]|nr:hypothetical protein [Planctomycetota bacterium]
MKKLRLKAWDVRPGDPSTGFTILEILIASAVLVIGLVGVLALFPAGIASGRRVVEDSTAIAIARSVADAIRSGMRNHLRVRQVTGATAYTHFIFHHDGVKDWIPKTQDEERPEHDYYILLPRFRDEFRTEGGNEMENRNKAVQLGKTFVYPESDPDGSSGASPNGGGDPLKADDDKDDYVLAGVPQILVRQVYQLGDTFPAEQAQGPDVLEDQKVEVLKQYSFAFAVRPSRFDANMSQYGTHMFQPANELYHFRVMIFRRFVYADGNPPLPPVFELDFEVAR